MQENKYQIIFSIISASVFVLLIVLTTFLLFRIYLKKKNKLIQEKQLLKVQYDQMLLQSQLEIQEQAFTLISEEIHDNIGQVLSLVRLNLNTLGSQPAEEKINSTDALLGKAISDLRNLSHNLNSHFISNVGLTEALRQLLDHLHKTGQFDTQFHTNDYNWEISEGQLIIVYRTIQELINNIIKHAAATEITIRLTENLDRKMITISDNGKGFDPLNLSSEGLGLQNIKKRAAMIQADIEIKSAINEGTSITILL
jgi:signal transduction histidine kinase